MNENIQNKCKDCVVQEQVGVVSSLCSQEALSGEVGLSLHGPRKLILVRLGARISGSERVWMEAAADALTEAFASSASQVLWFLTYETPQYNYIIFATAVEFHFKLMSEEGEGSN